MNSQSETINSSTKDSAGLREKAAEIARDEKLGSQINIEAMTPEEIQQMFYELRVRQIELDLQNQELNRSQEALRFSRERYLDIYEQAPVGYMTLSREGLVQEANLTAAAMLGVERAWLSGQALSRLILKEDQDIYYLHRKLLFETGQPQSSELRMQNKDGIFRWVQLDWSLAYDPVGCQVQEIPDGSQDETDCSLEYRIVMSDISEIKQTQEQLQKTSLEVEQYFNLSLDLFC
ncbi:MAG: PAS domain-containing protein, partial [Desulfonatronovibrio sp.]